ncbi:histone acetyltransferase KAT6B-like isoform X1 [Watersipora subatra]|uniref:histone acetyltransferase KAT6B-like isoform X1 n=1 Tax=Watersipora subatra TaxID=2589382 RepID=UPI00355B0015
MGDKKRQQTLTSMWSKKGTKTPTNSSTKSNPKLSVTKIQTGWLLDAVRHIKAQKQRPDKDRIGNYIRQHHDLTAQTVSLLLDTAVKEQILTTTITRGNTDKLTYVITGAGGTTPKSVPASHSASKKTAVSTSKAAPRVNSSADDKKTILHNKSDISLFMVQAVKALRDSAGSSLNDIAEYILTSCKVELMNGVDLIRLVKLSARQAVRNSMLIKSKDNLYKIPRSAKKSAMKPGDQNSKSGQARPKIIPICSFCLGDEKKNTDKLPEEMVSCCRCGQSGHPSCLKFSKNQTEVVKSLQDWECYDCKKCFMCKISKGDDNDMLICDRCDRSFHPHCCRPPVKKPPDGTWICHLCLISTGKLSPGQAGKNKVSQPQMLNGRAKWGLLRKKYEYKRSCKTPGCDGSGNTNSTMSNHRRQASCPLLSKEERKRLRQQKDVESDSDTESRQSNLSANDSGLPPEESSALKGLTDGLSQFFTPTDKRTSRVSMSSMLTAASQQPVKQPKSATTTSQAAANKLLKKSKLVQRSKAQATQKGYNNNNNINKFSEANRSLSTSSSSFSLTEHINSLPGGNQLKGLVDGMTRFFTPAGQRKRSMPLYVPMARKRKDTDKSGASRSAAEDSDGVGLLSDEGKSDADVADSIDKANLPPGVTSRDYCLFRKSQKDAKEPGSMALLAKPVVEHGKRYPPMIEFGKYEISTWYSSPYPQEYAQLSTLYICEFCLKYMKSKSILIRHMEKCGLTHPPANEIYRHDGLSVFEVDGNANKIYCQNLCLLAKLFLDHKTLYYDVEPFLFYVLTFNDEEGCHFVGYFSKEKQCQQKYNVSCITTLPQHQRKGYGKFLIDFSYLLSRKEGNPGSPEKPLSELGKISYKSYWKWSLMRHLDSHKSDSDLTIKSISVDTGMCAHDIASTLQELHMIDVNTAGEVIICLNLKVIAEHMAKLKASTSRQYVIDEEYLRWTPLVSKHPSSSPEKSSPEKPSTLTLIRERRMTAEQEVDPEPVKSPPPRRASTRSRQASLRSGPGSPPSTRTEGVDSREPSPAAPISSPRPITRQSPVRSSLSRATKKPARKLTNGPVLANGTLPPSLRRRQSLVSSSDEDEDLKSKPKPPPPKKRRASCREEKISRRKSGSPSTPEKKGKYSSSRSSSLRSQSRNGRQQNSSSSRQDKSASADSSKNGKRCCEDAYMTDASSVYSDRLPCYDASASDIDSGNSEMELSSNESAVWSPSMQNRGSDSGSVNDEMMASGVEGGSATAEAVPTECFRLEGNAKELEGCVELAAESKHSEYSTKKVAPKEQLPLPQSYPPNSAPEIDPASLCFESPISLSSNDTSLNGSQMTEHNVSQLVSSGQPFYEYTDNGKHMLRKPLVPHSNLQQHPHDTDSAQPSCLEPYADNIPSIAAKEQSSIDYPVQQSFVDGHHKSPSTIQIQHQQSPMFPPQQSPQVLLPNSPHVAPQSPQVPHKSPLMLPNSPHITPQSPHFTHTGPMLSPGPQQTPYNNQRCRAGSISKVNPPDLTPPPGTPSPSKHTSPDRYHQYLQQTRVPQKSPNVTVNSREMQYSVGNLPPNLNQNMQNLQYPVGYPQSYHQSVANSGQHFFPANQYLEPGYLNSYQMQLAQAATPSPIYNAHVPAGNSGAASTAMYGYH